MASINDISDVARILREQPEWADTIRSLLLGRELLDLPEQFAEFVQLTNQNFQLVHERFEQLETRMERIETDVAELKTDVAQLKTDVAELKTDMTGVKTDVADVKTSINRINGRLDNGFGMNYEYKVEKNIGSIMGQSLRVRRTQVIQGGWTNPDPVLMELIERAEEDGVITEEETNDVMRLDIICSGHSRDSGSDLRLAAEISITIGEADIIRAARRAAILSSIINQPVIPAVIGSHIDDPRTQLAAATNVTIILEPDE